jgi:hypothetical protein
MPQANTIQMGEHDHKQCAHIPQKESKALTKSYGTKKSYIKTHTPYLKDHYMKNIVNMPKQK